MNFVFLSPNFPPNWYLFCVRLRQNGFNVLAVGEDDFSSLRPELREALSWYCKVGSLKNYGELSAAARFLENRFGKIDRLDSLNEYWLETEAGLRTDFSIPGIKTDTILQIRRKSEMKKIFSRAGLGHAAGRLAPSAKEAHDFASGAGFPVVLKPDDGMGAAHTYKLRSHGEIDGFFAQKPPRDFIAEEFLDGDIVTYDGLAGAGGEIIFETSHTYDQGVMEAISLRADIYYYSARELPQDVVAAGRKLVSAFGVNERFFHFEFMRLLDGRLKCLEVNIRPPGGFTVDMFNYACDFDIYDIWARMMAGKNPRPEYQRKYHVCFMGRKTGRNYRHCHEEALRRLGELVAQHGPLPPMCHADMGSYGYIARSARLDGILKAVSVLHSLKT